MTKILVIGGGPGGYVAAIRAAQLGAEVTLVEKENIGGTCLNVGCIPTKALLHSAELFVNAKEGAKMGVIASPELDFAKVQSHKSAVTAKLVKGVEGLLKANKVNIIRGTARFEGPREVVVDTKDGAESVSADKIIIASGSVPVRPPIPGLEGESCLDSTGALALTGVPASMVIIGGGVIGVELATAYSAFNTNVTIVEMLPEILPMFDADLVKVVRRSLQKRGVTIMTGTKVLSVENGAVANVNVETERGAATIQGEKVLVCIGRRTNTDELGLDKAGIAHDRGRVCVNEYMETNVPGVYAIGDCLGKTMLAHVASAQGEAAAENALGAREVYDEKTNPSCVYGSPELAMVGMTEAQAQQKGRNYVVGKFPLSANGKSLIENGGVGFVKIIAGQKYREILGVGIVGPRATDLIAEAALAIRLEATIDELISTIHAHPTVGEAMREAALKVDGRAIHMLNK